MATKKELLQALEDPKMRELMRDAGFKISRKADELVAKTFKIPKSTSEAFYAKIDLKHLKVQDAVEEAFLDWIKKG